MDTENLLKRLAVFKTSERQLRTYIEQDNDFKKICNEYVELGDTIRYLKNIVNVPIKQIFKQINENEELYQELEKEIRMFLEKEKMHK